jgi:hypothetical protein
VTSVAVGVAVTVSVAVGVGVVVLQPGIVNTFVSRET